MHNPLCLFTEQLLTAFITNGHKYFVRQTYARGRDMFDLDNKGAFLISHYTDKSKAHIHYQALGGDAHRFFYDLDAPGHLQKLQAAARQPQGYRIYVPLLPKEWRPSEMMLQKIRKYIDSQLHWKPARKDGVKTDLFLQFGELFLTLKWKTTEVKLPLAEVEKY